jgi:hypothetical protein
MSGAIAAMILSMTWTKEPTTAAIEQYTSVLDECQVARRDMMHTTMDVVASCSLPPCLTSTMDLGRGGNDFSLRD